MILRMKIEIKLNLETSQARMSIEKKTRRLGKQHQCLQFRQSQEKLQEDRQEDENKQENGMANEN